MGVWTQEPALALRHSCSVGDGLLVGAHAVELVPHKEGVIVADLEGQRSLLKDFDLS